MQGPITDHYYLGNPFTLYLYCGYFFQYFWLSFMIVKFTHNRLPLHFQNACVTTFMDLLRPAIVTYITNPNFISINFLRNMQKRTDKNCFWLKIRNEKSLCSSSCFRIGLCQEVVLSLIFLISRQKVLF